VVGDVLTLAKAYSEAGADELVFYEISASVEKRLLDVNLVENIASHIDIPFCVAGGIKSVADAARVLERGADKISINSPSIARPELIKELHDEFGKQCVVVGIDSFFDETTGEYLVYQLTGDPNASSRNGYDNEQLSKIRQLCDTSLIASGGAGSMQDFVDVFQQSQVDGALAASVFHKNVINIGELKQFLIDNQVAARLCK